MLRRGLIALALAAAVIAVVVLAGGGGKSARSAPALPGEVLVGPRVTLASLRGKPAIINFWALSCAPCRKEAPAYERLSTQLRGRATLVGVNWNEARSDAETFVSRYRWTFPVLRDGDGTIGDRYGFTGLPATFILDARGRIVDTLLGPQTAAELEAALARST